MRFTFSENYTQDKMPKPWVDYGSDFDELKTINKFFYDYVKVYDADNAGDEFVDFVFDNGKAFRLEYEWYIEYNPDWNLVDRMNIREIRLTEANVPSKKFHDFIGTTRYAGMPIAKRNLNYKNGMLGKHHSEETKKKMSGPRKKV